jgi:hypothetical protein
MAEASVPYDPNMTPKRLLPACQLTEEYRKSQLPAGAEGVKARAARSMAPRRSRDIW